MKKFFETVIQCGEMVIQLRDEIVSLISFLGDTAAAMWEGLCHPKRLRWKDFLFYMNTCGPDGLPITVM